MVKSSQKWYNIQVNVNNEEDTGRGEHVYIKGCDEGNKTMNK